MTIGSLFAGVGGLEFGLERAGLGPTIWQAEQDPYCLRVLAKHWPDARRYDDVRSIDAEAERPDIICGGFPCQDVSNAGKRAGMEGERSGLWREYARIIRELRPRFVCVENVSALLGRGFGDVLGDLAACGYDAEWDCIPAAAVGAPHRRDRVFVIAWRVSDAYSSGCEGRAEVQQGQSITIRGCGSVVDAHGERLEGGCRNLHDASGRRQSAHADQALANADRETGRRKARLPVAGDRSISLSRGAAEPGRRGSHNVANSYGGECTGGKQVRAVGDKPTGPDAERGHRWPPAPGDMQAWGRVQADSQPAICRVAARVPSRSHRLRALGNAVVPQVAEVIGRRIVELMQGARP